MLRFALAMLSFGTALLGQGVTENAGGTTLEKLTFTPMPGGRVHQVWVQSNDDGKNLGYRV